MCLSPILIDNPYYRLHGHSKAIFGDDYLKKSVNVNLYLKDCTSRKIEIPCGKCPDCLHLRQQYLVQRTICESFDNDLFFCTLTYNRVSLPHVNVNGYNIAYADIKHVQDMMKRIRKNYNLPKFRYLCVSEFGKTTNRPHFHLLLSFPKVGRDHELYKKISFEQQLHSIFLKEWRINKGSTRKPVYVPLCDYYCTSRFRTFDLHYVNPSLTTEGLSDVAFYVTKYMLKVNPYVDALKSALFYNTPDYDTFKELWSNIRPRVLLSKGYGNPDSDSVKSHIRKGIDFSIDSKLQYPIFQNPITPHSSPLCPYYRRKFLTIKDAWAFYYMDDSNKCVDNVKFIDKLDVEDVFKRYEKFNKVIEMVCDSDGFYNSSELDYENDFNSFTKDYIGVPICFDKLNNNDLIKNESEL